MPTTPPLGKITPKRGQWYTAHYPVTAGQTFVVGDWVYITEAGTISIAASGGADVASNTQLLGRALANAADCLAQSGDAAECPVDCPAVSGQFLACVSADDAAGALALADWSVGTTGLLPTFGLRNAAVSVGGVTYRTWTLNKSEATDKCVVAVERHRSYPVNENFGLVWCSIHTDQQARTGAS